jgi:hypothetical protein
LQPPDRHTLSKSTFLKGCQCEKALYLNKHRPDLKDDRTQSQQAVFDRGTTVGEFAQQLFAGGVDVSPEFYYDYAPSVALTKHLIESGTEVIYEAAFQHDGVLAAIDILVKENGAWKGYEVKGSASVKEVNILDASLQYHVITQSGIDLKDISIIYLNNKYVRRGELDVKQLFTIESILEDVLERQKAIPEQILRLKQVLTLPETPSVDIGEHCFDPYGCDFVGHCWQHIPHPSVFDIAKLQMKRATELYRQGIVRFADITEEIDLSPGQRLQVTAHLGETVHIDIIGLRSFLSALTYPMYFLDFETFWPGIPLYDNSRPFQHIPFQYSLHYKKNPEGDLRHTEFLATPDGDPRLAFIENLLGKTRMPGAILTYNQNFEIQRLKELGRDFPQYAGELNERISRVRDLMVPFRGQLYYHPAMEGSFSLKAVLPAVVPEMNYDHLSIAAGDDASLAFEQMIYDLTANHEEIRKDLLEYCKMDTLAMVRILEKLERLTA